MWWCGEVYIGQTSWHISTKMTEHNIYWGGEPAISSLSTDFVWADILASIQA
jgi:hypothetical protein